MFAQVVIAMAHHDYLGEEGGHLMIEFVVKQCALSSVDAQVSFTVWFKNKLDNFLKVIFLTNGIV